MKVKFIFNLVSASSKCHHGHVCKEEEVEWIESGMEVIFPFSGQCFKIASTSLIIGRGELMAWITKFDGSRIFDHEVGPFKGQGWQVVDIGFGQPMMA